MPPQTFSFPVRLLAAGGLVFSLSLLPSATHAQVPASGTFTATQACPATQSIRGGRNPGNIQLTVGQRYELVGFNTNRREYAWVVVPGANPPRRWVAFQCGQLQGGAVPSPSPTPTISPTPRPTTSPTTNLLPFFDNVDNPVLVENDSTPKDISPRPPALTAFDQRVLGLCGRNFNDPVSPQQFSQLMGLSPNVLTKIKEAVGGEIRPGRRSNTAFIADLTQIWFNQQGFKHIFCGELDGRNVGGLHFHGRYLQFQNAGIAGRITRTSNGRDAKEEVVDGVIYTLGVAIRQGNRTIAEAPIKGYGYSLNAEEILIHGTRAFKLFKAPANRPQNQSSACLYTVQEPQVPTFQAVFVKKADAIRTFFPDATPQDARVDGACGG